ncbi:TonB-dependent receptor [Pedobacter sp. MW01-1-1]|uniref:TonB-dependent receptor n=1 Tax=Pedobacter sp. MW01-1-1 TaxID=3383027 RepID=UPI003FF0EF90
MKKLCTFVLGVALYITAHAQQNFKAIVVAHGNKPIVGATVMLLDTKTETRTDSNGVFSLTLPNEGGELHIVALGYQHLTIAVQANRRLRVFHLHPLVHQLEEVNVQDKSASVYHQSANLNTELIRQSFIQRNLGGSLMQTLSRQPGVKSIGIGSGQSKPLIRGLGFNRVLVLDKGMKHEGQQWGADHGLEVDQFATGDIRIIKGAASFMYGSDAIGGAIDVTPSALPKENSLNGSVDLVAKSNTNQWGGSFNLRGRSKHFLFDTRYTYQNYGDYRVPTDVVNVYNYPVVLYKNHVRNTAGSEQNLHLTTGYASEHLKSIFYISNLYSKSGFFANAHGLEPRRVDASHDDSSRDMMLPNQTVNHFKVINQTDWHQGKHDFNVSLGYQRNYRDENSQYVNHGFMPAIYPNWLAIPQDLERHYDKSTFLGSFKDKLILGRHQLNMGVNAEYQNNKIGGWGFLIPAFKQLTIGSFVFDDYKINEHWKLLGALRYDYGDIHLNEYNDWFESTLEDGSKAYLQRASNLHRTFNSLVWSAGANYTEDEISFKFNVGKSFRMPIAKELGANGVNYHYYSYEKGNASLRPEKSYQADVVLGWRPDKFTIQFTPFFNYFPNYIYLNPTPYHDYAYGAGNQVFEYQESEVLRYGAELQVEYNLLNNLNISALGEYLYAIQLSGDKQGFGLPFAPPASVLFNATYEPKMASWADNTFFSLDYRITATQNRIVPPEKKTDGYHLINLQAGTRFNWNNEKITLSLQVQNLLNTKYFQHTSFYRLIDMPEQGRNIVLSVKVPFNIHK